MMKIGYGLVENGVCTKFPYNEYHLRQDIGKQKSLPREWTDAKRERYGILPVFKINPRSEDVESLTHEIVWNELPTLTPDNILIQEYTMVALTPEAQAAKLAALQEQVQAEITTAVQARLDNFARTRNYGGILSACTYAQSAVPKFKAEGLYCVQLRDDTWNAMYAVLAEVLAGTRAMPRSIEDIEADLPAMVWPE